MAERLVSKLGGNPLDDASVRAAATWIAAENGQNVQNNNPFNLVTQGMNDLPGQVTRTPQGLAVFSTPEAGFDARSGDPGPLPRDRHGHPQGRRRDGAGRSPELELARGWLPGRPRSGLQLVRAKDQDRQRQGVQHPQSLQSAAAIDPEVADLFNVNVADPALMAWFNENVTQLQRAYANYDPTQQRSSGSWTFVGLDGKPKSMSFAPDMYSAALQTKADISRWQVTRSPPRRRSRRCTTRRPR